MQFYLLYACVYIVGQMIEKSLVNNHSLFYIIKNKKMKKARMCEPVFYIFILEDVWGLFAVGVGVEATACLNAKFLGTDELSKQWGWTIFAIGSLFVEDFHNG